MRLTIAAMPVVIGRVELTIKEPHIVRALGFEMKATLVMTQGRPDYEEVPLLFIEASPDKPVRMRDYCIIKHGESIVVQDDEIAVWVATGTGRQLGVVHVFEMRRLPS